LFNVVYELVAILQTFQIKRLAHAVKEGTLDNLITELLLWLLDERVPLMDDGSQLLNVSVCNMVRVYVRSSTPTIHVHLMYCHVGGFSLLYITRNRWPEGHASLHQNQHLHVWKM
jgi:hypothetical protein